MAKPLINIRGGAVNHEINSGDGGTPVLKKFYLPDHQELIPGQLASPVVQLDFNGLRHECSSPSGTMDITALSRARQVSGEPGWAGLDWGLNSISISALIPFILYFLYPPRAHPPSGITAGEICAHIKSPRFVMRQLESRGTARPHQKSRGPSPD